jgi:hypothetical protein
LRLWGVHAFVMDLGTISDLNGFDFTASASFPIPICEDIFFYLFMPVQI